jgi:hypothetical protein
LGLDTETFMCMMMVIITKSTSLINTRRIFTSLSSLNRVTEIEGGTGLQRTKE